MIVRDAAATVERAIASVRPYVGVVCVYLAGESVDDTVGVLERVAAQPGAPLTVQQGEWRDDFAWARTQSFGMVDERFRWVLWLDDGAELFGGQYLAAYVAEAEQRELPFLQVQERLERDGEFAWNPREFVVDRRRGAWQGIVHEHFRTTPLACLSVRQMWVARHGPPRAPGHYLPLLERAAQDPARTPRAFYLLARELERLGRHLEASQWARRYLDESWDAIEGDKNEFRLWALEIALRCVAIHAPGSQFEREARRELDAYERYRASPQLTQPGRNEACPCGSGKKFKRCHGSGASPALRLPAEDRA